MLKILFVKVQCIYLVFDNMCQLSFVKKSLLKLNLVFSFYFKIIQGSIFPSGYGPELLILFF